MMVSEAARKKGLRVIAVAHLGETDASLAEQVDVIEWVKLGQLGRIIKTFKKNNVTQALMAGAINKKNMFGNIKPDLKGLAMMSRIAVYHDDNILGALAGEFKKEGIEIVSSTTHLPELLADLGCFTKRKPAKSEKEDIDVGWKVAKELGRLDIGQCVVVRNKTVLALEAIDGTNATITRGGNIAGEKAVVVKVSKPHQDMRFDVPSVGLETIQVMADVKVSALAIEEGKTLMFDKKEMIDCADRHGISIISR